MYRRVAQILCVSFLACSSNIALSAPWQIDPATSKVTFHAGAKVLSSRLDVNATGGVASGTVDVNDGYASGSVNVDLTRLDTDNPERNGHMHDKYLKTKTYPNAVFKLDAWKLSADGSQSCGQLTIVKDTRRVCGDVKAVDEGGKKHVTGTWKLKINDYPSIGNPEFNGASLHNDVEVSVDVWAVKK